jgi:hypothetical protein
MQFKVPQFLEIEDKIFGPFTFKEFVYLAGGAGLCFILYKLLGIFIGMVPMLAVAGLSLALTFYKPNNKPFVDMLEASFKYFTQDKLYIWKRHELRKGNTGSKDQNLVEINSNKNNYEKSRLTGNKLRDLAWSLDVLDLKK